MSEIVHQATCVAIKGRGLLIEGEPGTGKSSLALALIDRGATLVGDDSVVLSPEGERLLARPHPQTRGLLEVRGVGLIHMPVAEAVPIALVLDLTAAAPRYIEAAETRLIAGIRLPLLCLDPRGSVLPLRAELALREYGLFRS